MNSNFAVQPPAIAAAMLQAMPQATYVGTFGMTETAGTVTTSRLDDPLEQRIKRLGKPLPGVEVCIFDPRCGLRRPQGTGARCWFGATASWRVTTKTRARRPRRSMRLVGITPATSAPSMQDGTLMFHGRLKDMLKVGGENVAAAEIEGCLQRHPAVKLAQVVGIPDPRLVEVPAAFVERKPGAEVSAEELVDFCRREIAGFKVPRQVRFVTEWPMSASKIQKFRLRDELVRELGV